MLKQQYRLPAHTRFSNTRNLSTSTFTLKSITTTLPYTRFGFVVSKKIDKRAVIRNRTRRVFRSCIEHLQNTIRPGYDMLFIVHKKLDTLSETTCQEITQILMEKGFLYEDSTITKH